MDNTLTAGKWLLAMGVLTVVLIGINESEPDLAAGLAALIAGSATFVMLPGAIDNLGFGSNDNGS